MGCSVLDCRWIVVILGVVLVCNSLTLATGRYISDGVAKCRTFVEMEGFQQARVTEGESFQYHNSTFYYGDASRYRMIHILGAGTFAEGYIGYDNIGDRSPLTTNTTSNTNLLFSSSDVKSTQSESSQLVVVKVYYNEDDRDRIIREILALQVLCDKPHIVRLLDVILADDGIHPALVFEYIPSTGENDQLALSLSQDDIRGVSKQILRALESVHQEGIIHRDIKLDNIILQPEIHHVKVIDFSLARFYRPDIVIPKAGTLPYESPEIIMGYGACSTAVDIWAFGVAMLRMLSGTTQIMRSGSSIGQLEAISKVFGLQKLLDMREKYHLTKYSSRSLFTERTPTEYPGTGLSQLLPNVQDPVLLDFLDKALTTDPEFRWSATQLLAHPYFSRGRSLRSGSPSPWFKT